MNEKINEIINRIKQLERELALELDKARERINYQLIDRKIRFRREVLQQHRKLKIGLLRYALFPRLRHVLVAPFIYAVFVPLVALDLLVTLYHAVCFPILGIPKVNRSDYMIYDHQHLAYLNALEKLNCLYCSYGNGLLSYIKEIVARTEQYWCPIKHAQRVLDAHSRYGHFTEYGDAEAFRQELEKIRKDF